MSRFNLDAISGQELSGSAKLAVDEALKIAWADPKSLYSEGKSSAQLLELCRQSTALALNINHSQVRFVLSSREALENIIASSASSTVVHTAIDRRVVVDSLPNSRSEIGVDHQGHISKDDLAHALGSVESVESTLVVIQWANQEVGTVQGLLELTEVVKASGAKLAIDATAALGYLDFATEVPTGWDFLFADSLSWGGSRLTTVVAYANQPPIFDDSSSVPEIARSAIGLEVLRTAQPKTSQRLAKIRDRFESEVAERISDVQLIDVGHPRLPHVTTLSIPFIDAEALADSLDERGIAIGSGSACANDVGVPSHVLAALGALTQGNVRLSLPLDASNESIDRLIDELGPIVVELKKELSSSISPSRLIDARGLLCPQPVIELASSADRLKQGGSIEIITDDPAALVDIPAWCRLSGAKLVTQEDWEPTGQNLATKFTIEA